MPVILESFNKKLIRAVVHNYGYALQSFKEILKNTNASTLLFW